MKLSINHLILIILIIFVCNSFGSDEIDSEMTKTLLVVECKPGKPELILTRTWKSEGDVWPFRDADSKNYFTKLKDQAEELSPRSLELFFSLGATGPVSKSTILEGGHFPKPFRDIPDQIDGCPTHILIADLQDRYRYSRKYIVNQDLFLSLSLFDQYVVRQYVGGQSLDFVRTFSDSRTLELESKDRLRKLQKAGSLSGWYGLYEVTADVGELVNKYEGDVLREALVIYDNEFFDVTFYDNKTIAYIDHYLPRNRDINRNWKKQNFYTDMGDLENIFLPKKQIYGRSIFSKTEDSEKVNCQPSATYRPDGSLLNCRGNYVEKDGTFHIMKTFKSFHVGFSSSGFYWWDQYEMERKYKNIPWRSVKSVEYALDGEIGKLMNKKGELELTGLVQVPKKALLTRSENCPQTEFPVSEIEEYEHRYGDPKKRYKVKFAIPLGCSGTLKFIW